MGDPWCNFLLCRTDQTIRGVLMAASDSLFRSAAAGIPGGFASSPHSSGRPERGGLQQASRPSAGSWCARILGAGTTAGPVRRPLPFAGLRPTSEPEASLVRRLEVPGLSSRAPEFWPGDGTINDNGGTVSAPRPAAGSSGFRSSRRCPDCTELFLLAVRARRGSALVGARVLHGRLPHAYAQKRALPVQR